jgi:uncharacterized repeat protein (TIGR03803 family)
MVQATDGYLYGTTEGGGAYDGGTVFKITPGGTFMWSYSFGTQSTDGGYPEGLLQATDGNLYGTTAFGGANGTSCPETMGCGTVFKITPGGRLTTVYSFCSQGGSACTDGYFPLAGLIQATDGNFYGTTEWGGADNAGTVFKITPSGPPLTTVYSFCSLSDCTDGADALAGLIQAADGNFYGTTALGGANGVAVGGYGTVFKITPSGTLTTLYSFCSQSGCTDGADPEAALVQGTDGNLYGTTEGGANGSCELTGSAVDCGTVFKITPGGTLKTLHTFCSESDCTDGAWPTDRGGGWSRVPMGTSTG